MFVDPGNGKESLLSLVLRNAVHTTEGAPPNCYFLKNKVGFWHKESVEGFVARTLLPPAYLRLLPLNSISR